MAESSDPALANWETSVAIIRSLGTRIGCLGFRVWQYFRC